MVRHILFKYNLLFWSVAWQCGDLFGLPKFLQKSSVSGGGGVTGAATFTAGAAGVELAGSLPRMAQP